jgi:hypothetical protein
MSQQQPSSGLTNPQILVAVIGALTTVIVAAIGVIPNIIASTKPPTPTNTPIVITATPIPPSNTPISIVIAVTAIPPSDTPIPSAIPASDTPLPSVIPATATENPPTSVPTEITVVPSSMVTLEPPPTSLPIIPTTESPPVVAQASQPPNVRLMYDGVSFTLLNESGHVLSLEGVHFRGGGKEWDARSWGPSIYVSLPAGWCLRLRDAAAGQRQPPAPCQNKIYGLIEVGSTAFFWRDVASFEVVQNGNVIATCTAEDGSGECEVYVG